MLKTHINLQPSRLGEAAIAASRQMWLAGLGAAVVTRDWMQSEAGEMFKSLAREGAIVESRAIRFVGDRIETSVSVANMVWKETRKNVKSTVKVAADAAVSFASQVLPKFEPPLQPTPRRAAAKSPKRAKRTVKVATKAKRTGRGATKRA